MTQIPECGTVAARTHTAVFYRAAGGIDVAEFESCCQVHESPGLMALLDEAETVQITVEDGYEQRITEDTVVRHKFNPTPGHVIDPEHPWSWTQIKDLPVITEPYDPDEPADIEVMPKPADVHRRYLMRPV